MQLERRTISPKPGMRAWMSDSSGYPLPEGLVDRQEVRVVGQQGRTRTVEDAQGKRYDVLFWQVDAGYAYRINGRYYRENTPQALDLLENYLRHLERMSRFAPWETAEQRQDIRFQLRRNGRNPQGRPKYSDFSLCGV
jgi:hypothetical protein